MLDDKRMHDVVWVKVGFFVVFDSHFLVTLLNSHLTLILVVVVELGEDLTLF